MSDSDLIVVGGGPAGGHAALAARSCGLAVTLIDEAPSAGGQVWRAPPVALADASRAGPDHGAGEALRAALRESRVRCCFGRSVWLARPGFEVLTHGANGGETFRAPALVVATGATERIVPFPGVVLPGVIGLGAATLLLKSQHVLPGRRTVVAGCGPLLAAVAVAILKGGGEVAAVIDLNGPDDWLRAAPRMLGQPRLLARGLAWLARLRGAGVPILWRHAVARAEGKETVDGVIAVPVDRDWQPLPGATERSFRADALAIGHGLTPSTEMTRLLGGEHGFAPDDGGWTARHDASGRTSVAKLYVAGDAAGIAGAATAVQRGRLAGLAAARDLGFLAAPQYDHAVAGIAPRLRRVERFGRAMAALMTPRPGLLDTVTAATLVCRCEDVNRATIDRALAAGACSVGQLKAWTRCGMGPCQGRMCGDTVAALAAFAGIDRQLFGQMVARPPLRPVALEALTGSFDYDDIALPPSLPS